MALHSIKVVQFLFLAVLKLGDGVIVHSHSFFLSIVMLIKMTMLDVN